MPFPEPDPRAVPVRWAALLVHPIAKGPERFVAAIAAVGPDGEASCRVMAGADRMVELFGEDADHVAGVDTAVESLSRHLGDGGGMADWTSPLESARLGDVVCRRTADGGTVATGVAGWPDTGPVDWGAAGTSAGSAALAINVLYAFSGDEGFAERRSGDFARDVVARVPPAGGTIRADDVRAWVADARRREQRHREIPDRRAGRSRR